MRTALLAAALCCATAATVQAATLVGVTADNRLVRIDSETGRAEAPVAVRGVEGRLLGIDVRPKDGRLYGVSDGGQIVSIDPASGAATVVSRLNVPFESGGRAVVDFNPVADRLRLMGMSGTNLRVNVDTGEAVRDGQLRYQPDTPAAGTPPRVTAGAYTNSVAGATATALYTIDTALGSYNLQAPPNDGVQQRRGELPGLPPGVAFDILADGTSDTAMLLVGTALRTVDVETGAQTATRAVSGLPAGTEIIDIAAMR